jgi:hypothetical protein
MRPVQCIGAEPITHSQTWAPSPACLRTQFSRDYYCLLCRTRNEIRVRYYYYMLCVDTQRTGHHRRCSSVPGRMGRVVLLMRFSSFAHRNRFAVCPLFARLKPSAPEVNPDNMSKAADGFLCAVNIYNIVCLSTSSFKINRLTVKRARSLCCFLLKIMKKTTKCCCDPVF